MVALRLLASVLFVIYRDWRTKVYQVGIPVFGSPIDGGRATLMLDRTDEGVKVSGEL
ncbi:MAG: hypothetical protein QXP65_01220 [Candidatus Hadarchaeales archaeon]